MWPRLLALADELAIEVAFQPGDMLFMLQHVTLHSRTEFEDWPEAERKRHILRLWLTTHGARPLTEEFAQQMVGIRVPGWKYLEYETGEMELYDLSADPYEMENLAGVPEDSRQQQLLGEGLDALARCAGDGCADVRVDL